MSTTTRIIEHTPSEIAYHNALHYITTENYQGAFRELKDACQLNPEAYWAYADLAMLCRKSRDAKHHTKALEHIKTAFGMNPKSLQVRFIKWNIENFCKKKKDFIEQQTDYMNQLVNECKDSLETLADHLFYAKICSMLGKTDDALEAYTTLSQKPQYSNVLTINYDLGSLLIRKKNFKDAYVYLQKAQKIAPVFLKCLIDLGYVLSELKENDSAIEIYKQILKIDPSYSDAYYSIGQNMHDKTKSSKQKYSPEDYQKALMEALAFNEKALELKPDNPLYLLGKADILKFLNTEESKCNLEEVLVELGLIWNQLSDEGKKPFDNVQEKITAVLWEGLDQDTDEEVYSDLDRDMKTNQEFLGKVDIIKGDLVEI